VADVTAGLRALRTAAGNPSFAELASRVGDLRTRRRMPSQGRTPSRVTVHDCFRPGRSRLDVELVRALGGSETDVAHWRAACGAVTR
jgi:hypothetical protein